MMTAATRASGRQARANAIACRDPEDGGQLEPVDLETGIAFAARRERAVGDVDRLDAVDDRAAERAGDAYTDLEAARIGGFVSEQERVEDAGIGFEGAHRFD